jgi:hypothetical protein
MLAEGGSPLASALHLFPLPRPPVRGAGFCGAHCVWLCGPVQALGARRKSETARRGRVAAARHERGGTYSRAQARIRQWTIWRGPIMRSILNVSVALLWLPGRCGAGNAGQGWTIFPAGKRGTKICLMIPKR